MIKISSKIKLKLKIFYSILVIFTCVYIIYIVTRNKSNKYQTANQVKDYVIELDNKINYRNAKKLDKIEVNSCYFITDVDIILYQLLSNAKKSIRFYYYIINIDIVIFNNKTLYDILKQKLEENIFVEMIMSKKTHQLLVSDKYYNSWSKLNTYSNFKCRLYGNSYLMSPILHIKNIVVDDFILISNAVLGNNHVLSDNFLHSMFVCRSKMPIDKLQFVINIENNINNDIQIIHDALNQFNCYDHILNSIKESKKEIIILMQWVWEPDFFYLLNEVSKNNVNIYIITNQTFTDFQEDNFVEVCFNVIQKTYFSYKQIISEILMDRIPGIHITFINNHYIHENYIVIDNEVCIATTLNIDNFTCDKTTPTIEQSIIIKNNPNLISKVVERINFIKNIENTEKPHRQK